jgi:hypothetical protein
MRVTVSLVVMVTNDPTSSLSHFSTPLSAITVATDFPIYTSQRSAPPLIVVKGMMYLFKLRFKEHIHTYISIYMCIYIYVYICSVYQEKFTLRECFLG